VRESSPTSPGVCSWTVAWHGRTYGSPPVDTLIIETARAVHRPRFLTIRLPWARSSRWTQTPSYGAFVCRSPALARCETATLLGREANSDCSAGNLAGRPQKPEFAAGGRGHTGYLALFLERWAAPEGFDRGGRSQRAMAEVQWSRPRCARQPVCGARWVCRYRERRLGALPAVRDAWGFKAHRPPPPPHAQGQSSRLAFTTRGSLGTHSPVDRPGNAAHLPVQCNYGGRASAYPGRPPSPGYSVALRRIARWHAMASADSVGPDPQ